MVKICIILLIVSFYRKVWSEYCTLLFGDFYSKNSGQFFHGNFGSLNMSEIKVYGERAFCFKLWTQLLFFKDFNIMSFTGLFCFFSKILFSCFRQIFCQLSLDRHSEYWILGGGRDTFWEEGISPIFDAVDLGIIFPKFYGGISNQIFRGIFKA